MEVVGRFDGNRDHQGRCSRQTYWSKTREFASIRVFPSTRLEPQTQRRLCQQVSIQTKVHALSARDQRVNRQSERRLLPNVLGKYFSRSRYSHSQYKTLHLVRDV